MQPPLFTDVELLRKFTSKFTSTIALVEGCELS